MSFIIAGVANGARKKLSHEAGNFIADPKFRKKRLMQLGAGALVVAGAGGGLWNTFSDNMNQVLPLTHGTTVEVGKQEVKDINLALDESCITGFTVEATSMAKYDFKAGLISLYWKSQKEVADYDIKLCMDSSEVKAKLYTGGGQPDKIVMHVASSAVRTEVSLNPLTLRSTPDMSLTAVPLENLRNLVNATPFLEDAKFIQDGVAMVDGSNDVLTSAALVKAGDSAATKCLPGVQATAMPAFQDGLAGKVLLGAQLYNPDLTRADVTVLVGDAKTEADNAVQPIGQESSYSKANATLTAVLKANNSISFPVDAKSNSVSTCEVSNEVKQQATTAYQQAQGANNGNS